jgi:hypothetical protein
MPRASHATQLSKYDIENKILDYFADEQGVPRGSINRNTDLKAHFAYGDANWASEAAPISDLPWMRALNVEIAQSEMPDNVTAKDLADVIWSKVTKLVSVWLPTATRHAATFSSLIAINKLSKPQKGPASGKTKTKLKAKKARR